MSLQSLPKLDYIKIALELNFYISVIALIAYALSPFIGADSFFLEGEEIYGPLGNNLHLIGIYLAISDLLLWIHCFIKKDYSNLAFWGLFHLLIPSALQMYGEVNDLPIDYESAELFWYTGLSRIAFGIYSMKNRFFKGAAK